MKKRHLVQQHIYEKEEKLSDVSPLFEFVTVSDLQDEAALSDKTAEHLADREILSGDAKNNILLDNVLIEDDFITFRFTSFATIEKYSDDHEYKKVGKRHRLERNPTQEYSIYLKFLDTRTWIKNMKKRGRVDIDNIKALIKSAYVQLWSTSPAFHYQGHNYWASELDASIFPTNIKPRKWDKVHDETQLDKHTAQLLMYLSDYYKDMAKDLSKEIRRL